MCINIECFSEKNIIYQFHGCQFHGCKHCYPLRRDDSSRGVGKTSYDEKFKKTEETTKYLRDLGYEVVEMWECVWDEKRKKLSPGPWQNKYFYPTEHKFRLTEKEILKAVREDKLFGALEVDINVPDNLKEYFAELPPIFKNCTVTHEDIGSHMQDYLTDRGRKFPDTKYLVASMMGEKIVLITPILKWLLEKGLIVTKIYQVLEFDRRKCFNQFADDVSNDRRAGMLLT